MDNEDKMLLAEEELDKVSGGVRNPTRLYTVEEVEASPVFEILKSFLRTTKKNIGPDYESRLSDVELYLNAKARENGYVVAEEARREFIAKYWPLV